MKIPITPIAEKKETNKPSGAKVGASTEQSAELDMKEVAYLDLAGFRRSILEMADLWTDSIDHNEYIKFIQVEVCSDADSTSVSEFCHVFQHQFLRINSTFS